MTAFAVLLAAVRRRAGVSQYALARRSGVSKQALSLLEKGDREPSWETVQRLALALGVDCSAFQDPDLTLPPQGPPPRMGRPPKGQPEAPAQRRKAAPPNERKRKGE
jgi:transcriptional regulator with XRE-family HTH domain